MRRTLAVLGAVCALGLGFATALHAAGPRTITIEATENLKFSVTHIDAKPGEQLKVVLKAIGSQPADLMAHNFVLLDQGTDVDAFVMNSAIARDNQYVAPAFKAKVIATTGLVAGGQQKEVTFTVPKKKGTYVFVCTFPAHYAAGMKGEMVVK